MKTNVSWRLLEIGETIQDGDEFYFIEPKLWTAAMPSLFGKQVDRLQVPFRRRIKNPWRLIKDAPTEHHNLPKGTWLRHEDGIHYMLPSDLPPAPVNKEREEFEAWFSEATKLGPLQHNKESMWLGWMAARKEKP